MGNILVIDDEAAVREIVAEAFRLSGHTVREAENGFGGVTVFDEETPDLVIVDVFMPGMDGIETLLQIRNRDQSVPVIAISGGGRGVALQYLKMTQNFGADRVIEKPFVLADLVATAAELMCPSP